MELPKGFHDEIIESRENTVSDTDASVKSKVSIFPLKSGGSNFKTNVLIEASRSKLIYKPYIGAALFSFIFLAVGLGVLFFGLLPMFKTNSGAISVNWFLPIFGLIFSGAGGFLFYYFYKPRVFDKQLGLYYSTYAFKLHKTTKTQSDNYIQLKSIVAIQIIGEHVKSKDGSYKSFELNLVLEDSSRLNVIDHGNLKSIIIDAEIISDFLKIPIWHALSTKD